MQSSKSCVEADPCNGLSLKTCFLPDEVLIHLFSFVDLDSLVFRCRSVCRQWQDIITDSRVWKLRIIRRRLNLHALSKYSDSEIKDLTVNYPWFLFYWILKNDVLFERNLLQNNCGQRNFEHWVWVKPHTEKKLPDEILSWNINGVNPIEYMEMMEMLKFEEEVKEYEEVKEFEGLEELNDEELKRHVVEKLEALGDSGAQFEYGGHDGDSPPESDDDFKVGCWTIIEHVGLSVLISTLTLPERDDFVNHGRCFSTDVEMCSKEQLINLSENGFPRKLLDEFQPPITISEWYNMSLYFKYWLKISLLDEGQREVIRVPIIEKTAGGQQWHQREDEWTKVSIAIKKYGPGLRYIKFEHAGNVMKSFPGDMFGTKMAGGVVRISLPEVKETNDAGQPSITIF